MSAHRFRPLARMVSLALACIVASIASMAAVSADVVPNGDIRRAYDDAIDATVLELSYLQMSDAFGGGTPSPIVQLPERLGLSETSAGDVTNGLATVNGQSGPTALLELRRLGQVLTPPVQAVLSADPVLSPIGVSWAPYVRAHHDLVVSRLELDGKSISPEMDTTGLLAVFGQIPVLDAGPTAVLSGATRPSPRGLEEPIDRGDPPEVLIQGDGIDAPVAGPAPPTINPAVLALDPVEMLIIAAVAVIVLGLITLLVTSKQRHPAVSADAGESLNRAFREATRVIHATENVEQLCVVAAAKARLLTEAESAAITIDGYEATDGAPFEVSTELVFRANRQACLVSDGAVHAIPVLAQDDEIIGLLVIKGGQVSKLEAFEPLVEDGYASVRAKEQTAALVFVDGLTGIANRRRFDTDLDTVVDRASETQTPVAVAMFDVDHFKTFNDNNGHQAGDAVLRAVAGVIATNLRSTDVVYRYGGEEFVALLPGSTVEDAYDVVERIRYAVECATFEGESCQPGGTVTLSVGVAAAPTGDGSMLVRAADMALYEAKTTGRNRVVVETHLA